MSVSERGLGEEGGKGELELVRESQQPVAILASKFSRTLFFDCDPTDPSLKCECSEAPLSLQSCEIFKRSLEAISGCLTPDRSDPFIPLAAGTSFVGLSFRFAPPDDKPECLLCVHESEISKPSPKAPS